MSDMGAPKGVAHRRRTDPSPARRGADELATHRRAIPALPRWTTHEREGRADTSNKPRVQSGIRFTGGPKEWCYLCNAEHTIEECPKAVPLRPRCKCDYCTRARGSA